MSSSQVSSDGLSTPTLVNAELHALLLADDVAGWSQHPCKRELPLRRWIESNALHAVESCPRVMASWKEASTNSFERLSVYKALGLSLEHTDEATKRAIFSGNTHRRAHAFLFTGMKKQRSDSFWTSLSPAWIGKEGSELRATVVENGWSNQLFLEQVHNFIDHPDAEDWYEWIPCMHSMVALHLIKEFKIFGSRPELMHSKELFKNHGHSWAKPDDMALARSLCKYTQGLDWTLSIHPDAAPIPPHMQQRMDSLVEVSMGLGMFQELQETIAMGNMPYELSPEPSLALPTLDTAAFGN